MSSIPTSSVSSAEFVQKFESLKSELNYLKNENADLIEKLAAVKAKVDALTTPSFPKPGDSRYFCPGCNDWKFLFYQRHVKNVSTFVDKELFKFVCPSCEYPSDIEIQRNGEKNYSEEMVREDLKQHLIQSGELVLITTDDIKVGD